MTCFICESILQFLPREHKVHYGLRGIPLWWITTPPDAHITYIHEMHPLIMTSFDVNIGMIVY
jgi:hypothetical protein